MKVKAPEPEVFKDIHISPLLKTSVVRVEYVRKRVGPVDVDDIDVDDVDIMVSQSGTEIKEEFLYHEIELDKFIYTIENTVNIYKKFTFIPAENNIRILTIEGGDRMKRKYRKNFFRIIVFFTCAVVFFPDAFYCNEKILLAPVAVLSKGVLPPPAASKFTDTISQYGVTWTFDKEYQTGQFVSGDYWVAGPLTVLSVNPPPARIHGTFQNGSMINPSNGTQSYDSRTEAYGHPYNPDLGVSFPVTVPVNSSLVSTISVEPDNPKPRPVLRGASVLTVLAAPPPSGSFRPGLIGTEKKLFNYYDIRWDVLPSLTPVSSIPFADVIAKKYTRALQRPWILQGTGWLHRHIMPVDNSPSYHREVAMLLDEASVLCLANWGDRNNLVTNYIQVAIDYYAMQKNGLATGVQGAYNYRWPTVFAGIMLGDNEMRDMWRTHTYSTPSYHENTLYYWESRKRTLSSKIIPPGDTWTLYRQRTRKRAVFYGLQGGANANNGNHEELHPSEWNTLIDVKRYSGGGAKQETYRQMHSASIPGFALSAYVFDAVAYMDFPEYFDYADRWMTETAEVLIASGSGPLKPYRPQTSYSTFVDQMWNSYRPYF